MLFVWSKHHSGASRLAVSVYAVSVRRKQLARSSGASHFGPLFWSYNIEIYYCVAFSTPSPLLPTHPTDIEGFFLTLVTPNSPITTSSAHCSHLSILHLDMYCGSQIQGIWINPHKSVMLVRRGKFYRLFNALLPADDTFHELGVPEYHKPLFPSLLDHIDEGSLSFNNYCSARVSVEAELSFLG